MIKFLALLGLLAFVAADSSEEYGSFEEYGSSEVTLYFFSFFFKFFVSGDDGEG